MTAPEVAEVRRARLVVIIISIIMMMMMIISSSSSSISMMMFILTSISIIRISIIIMMITIIISSSSSIQIMITIMIMIMILTLINSVLFPRSCLSWLRLEFRKEQESGNIERAKVSLLFPILFVLDSVGVQKRKRK